MNQVQPAAVRTGQLENDDISRVRRIRVIRISDERKNVVSFVELMFYAMIDRYDMGYNSQVIWFYE